MSHLIISLGKDNVDTVHKIIAGFDNVYLISDAVEEFTARDARANQKVAMMLMPDVPAKDLVEALYQELKIQLSKDKIVDLDIAVNISSGTGRIHSAMIAAIMRLGYGIRLVDMQAGKLVEL
jgi:hypothetical protein